MLRSKMEERRKWKKEKERIEEERWVPESLLDKRE